MITPLLLIVLITSGHCRPIHIIGNVTVAHPIVVINIGNYVSNQSLYSTELNNGTIHSGFYVTQFQNFYQSCKYENIHWCVFFFLVELKEELPFQLYLAAILSAVVLAIIVSFGITIYYRSLKYQMRETDDEASWISLVEYEGDQQVSFCYSWVYVKKTESTFVTVLTEK